MVLRSARRRLPILSLATTLLFLFNATAEAQQTIEFGNGTVINQPFEFPAPYGNALSGARHQMLFLASELQAAGMTQGTISSVGFNVAIPSGTTFTGFAVSIGTTANDQLNGQWETGLVGVWGPQDYTDAAGWSVHPFDTPYAWDGVSNLVVQTCYFNGPTSQNAQMFQTPTTFTSCVSRSTPNNNVCMSPTGTHVPVQQRPDMRFEWTAPAVPPVGAFTQSTIYSCDGSVQFADNSSNLPTDWHWAFGDGGTDSIEAPLHTYLSDGTYTTTLIVSNAYGADTVTGPVITVLLNGPQPVAACVPNSTGSVAGFGILSVNINGNVNTSTDAVSEGYANNTCQPHNVYQGTPLTVSVGTGTITTHNVRAWADWDNSGTFTSNEMILNATSTTSASASITVPATAVLNTPLRLRAIAGYDLLNPNIDPCADIANGQAEDYALIVLENTDPPVAAFSASPVFTCDGAVQFTDLSLNAPTSWQWDLGDGTSTEQSPLHTYAASGTYTVTLVVNNAYGDDTHTETALITVDLGAQLIAAACLPETQSYCCGYGIEGFVFAGINSSSPDGAEGYQDRTCGNVATVEEGHSTSWSVTTGGDLEHDTRMWIDLNNDGAFTNDELVHEALNAVSPTAFVEIPSGGALNTPLRLRLKSDVVGQTASACDQPLYGQVEDFSIIITPNTDPPMAGFTASPTTTCDGLVQFTDATQNVPTSWSWNFGDTGSSTEQNPAHTYAAQGNYTVTLTATNVNGSDAETRTNYIHVVGPGLCDTLQVPEGTNLTSNNCYGVLTDDGGADGPYGPGESAAVTIAPTDAESVALHFSVFQWGNGPNRFLAVYDGPDVGSPLIGTFNGNGLGNLPNGGTIISSGSSITLRQEQQGGGPPPNSAGFVLNWSCSSAGIDESVEPSINIWPQPASDRFTVDLGAATGAGWNMQVTDLMGATIQVRPIAQGVRQLQVDCSGWAAGCYQLSLISPEGRHARTILVR